MSKSKKDTESNSRKYMRLPKPFSVQARELVFPIARDPMLAVKSNDISRGGICIESEVEFPLGTNLHITVHIPLLNKFSNNFLKIYENDADQRFQTIATVIWVKSQGDKFLVGLRFVDLDDTISEAIDKLINNAFSAMEKR